MNDITPNIDFSDSSYKSIEMSNELLVININSWDGKNIKISFFNVLMFTYRIGSSPAKIYEKISDASALNEGLSLYYEKQPKIHPFKEYSIIDIEDMPIFNVVAESVTIVKEEKIQCKEG